MKQIADIPVPRIEFCPGKKLVGMHLTMSLVNNNTVELWKSFMPKRNEIQHTISGDLISMQIYKPGYFASFQPGNQFEKWAAVEVIKFDHLPTGLERYTLEEGLYAVFHYIGSSHDNRIFQYIFNKWLPESNYKLDDRPHFEVLGNKYKNNDPSSEEEIWIPVQRA
jgi:AraC family transcriptional regulator